MMTLGGDGGVVLLFCLGKGGSMGAALAFSCFVGEECGGTWLIAFENGGRRCGWCCVFDIFEPVAKADISTA